MRHNRLMKCRVNNIQIIFTNYTQKVGSNIDDIQFLCSIVEEQTNTTTTKKF